MQRNGMEIDETFRQEFHDIAGMSANALGEFFALRGNCLNGGFRACDHFHRC